MTTQNFNWTLHAMLFLHTQKVIQKQNKKQASMRLDNDENEDVGIEIDRED
jgi:hypothetical protein